MFLIFLQQRPWDLLQGLIISCCIVFRVNGIVINIFLLQFWQYLDNFSNFWKIFVPIVWILKQGYWIVSRQWKGSQDIIVLNFSKILLKFAIVVQIFSIFCPFLSLTTITGQRNFSSLGDGLIGRTFETKNGFDFFLLRSSKLFFSSAFFQFFSWLEN